VNIQNAVITRAEEQIGHFGRRLISFRIPNGRIISSRHLSIIERGFGEAFIEGRQDHIRRNLSK
jgi:hypothetical protein